MPIRRQAKWVNDPGWLPGAADNLLPDIANGRLLPGLPRARSFGRAIPADWRDFASSAYQRGGALTLGLTRHGPKNRLVYWPRGIPRGTTFAVISSRLGRDLSRWSHWFRALRTAFGCASELGEICVWSRGIATSRYVERAAYLFGVPTLEIHPPRSSDRSWPVWLRNLLPTNAVPENYQAFVSPVIAVDAGAPRTQANQPVIPEGDALTCAASQRILALHVRQGGAIEHLIRDNLCDPFRLPGSIQVAVGERLLEDGLRDELLSSGALAWFLYRGKCRDPSDQASMPDKVLRHSEHVHRQAEIVSLATYSRSVGELTGESREDLVHCTRRRWKVWPDQSTADYLDQLIMEGNIGGQTAWDVLVRIVRTGQLLATGGMLRGGYLAVSFSAVPLCDLLRRRTYRAHRGSWDYEPYGVVLRRSTIEQLGGRPVVYGDNDLWESLDDAARPFFQKRYSPMGSNSYVDWSSEQEWRLIGNVDLTALPVEDVSVFVPRAEEAAELAAYCPWRVIVCAMDDHGAGNRHDCGEQA